MGWFDDLMNKGRSLLGTPKPTGTERVAVEHDKYDRDDWQETLSEATTLRNVIDGLSDTFDYTEDLTEGMYHYFAKAEPEVVDSTQMVESHRPNQKITLQGAETPEVQQLRQFTVGDPYTAAMGVIAVGEKLRDYLQDNKDLADAAREAEEKRKEREQAEQDVEDALTDAQAAQGDADPDAEGPPTEAQADAAAALQAAIDALQAAQDAQGEASEQLDTAMAQATPGTRQAVREGIREATEEATDQAAMMSAAGMDPGEAKYMDFTQREALAKALSSSKLSTYAKWIGRMRMEAAVEQARRVEHGRDVFVDVELGNNLSLVLGGEIAKLAGPRPMRLDTLRRYSERRLLQRKFEGTEKAGNGPIVAVVDTSGSMNASMGGPTRDCWAKGITFVLLDSARRQNRDFYAILFSSPGEQRHYHFPAKGEPMVLDKDGRTPIAVATPVPGNAELGVTLDLISFMFDGGTNYEQPLTQAVDVIESRFNASGHAKADIAFITDDDGHVSEEFMQRYLSVKERVGLRTWGFAVGVSIGNAMTAICDNVRELRDMDLADNDAIRDVMRQV